MGGGVRWENSRLCLAVRAVDLERRLGWWRGLDCRVGYWCGMRCGGRDWEWEWEWESEWGLGRCEPLSSNQYG